MKREELSVSSIQTEADPCQEHPEYNIRYKLNNPGPFCTGQIQLFIDTDADDYEGEQQSKHKRSGTPGPFGVAGLQC